MGNKLNKIDISKLKTIDPKAAVILSSAREAVHYIKRRREKMDREGLQNEPLYIISGEDHDRMAQILRHAIIMELLDETGEPIICGLERRDSCMLHHLSHGSQWDIDIKSPFFNQCFARADEKRQLRLKYDFVYANYHKAPYSTKVLMHYLVEKSNKIPVKFTDAPFIIDEEYDGKKAVYLDHNAPSLLKITKECFGDIPPPRPISASNHRGMRMRDRHAAIGFTDFAKEHSPRFAFHISGNAHLAGSTQIWENRIGKNGVPHIVARQLLHHHINSLSQQIKKLGGNVIVLPAISSCFKTVSIPVNQALKAYDEIVMCRQLSDDSFIFDDAPSTDDIFTSAESKWVDKRTKNLGVNELIIEYPDEIFQDYLGDVELGFSEVEDEIKSLQQTQHEI